MGYYWFSFSHKGKNTGVCVVKSTDLESANEKTIELEIHPAHDDIECYLVAPAQFSSMEVDRLYTPAEMRHITQAIHFKT